MPLRFYQCPDKQTIAVSECLDRCRRAEGRCLSLPTLMSIARQRDKVIWRCTNPECEWNIHTTSQSEIYSALKGYCPWCNGTEVEVVYKPSTTELIQGTRQAFLKLTEGYVVSPKDQAFALLGTRHHAKLESVAQKANALAEEKLDGEVTGILDLLTEDETVEGDYYHLWDYKTAGSYKVAQALGLVGEKINDPSGAVYKASGKWGNRGDRKKITVYRQDPEQVDMAEWELQMNHYRLMVEDLGFPVSKMTIQATVRDGGTQSARQRGIDQNIYLIPIRRLTGVRQYFAQKATALKRALRTGEMPPPCTDEESWNGRRCQGYCDVWQFCDIGRAAMQKLHREAKEEVTANAD